MKRSVSLILVLAVMLMLAACGTGNAQMSTSESSQTESTVANEPTVDEVSEKHEEPVEEEMAIEEEKEISFEEVTVVDNEQCTIKIVGIDPDNMWGYTLKAYMENKSADKTYMFSVTDAAVNGVQTDPLFASEIAAGKKSNEEINFMDSTLSDNKVGDFSDIEIAFKVYDSDDWMADAVALETVHIYPHGESNAVKYVREAQPTDTVIVDNESITIVVTDYDEDGMWGYTANLYLENKTGDDLMFCVDEVSVNGFMIDPFWADTVNAGKVSFGSISWFDSDFEENGITTVNEIEMKFRVYDSNDWMKDDVYNEVVTLHP